MTFPPCSIASNHRPRLEAIAGKFQDKPLIGFVSTLLQDYVPLIDEYYYCEFSSSPSFTAPLPYPYALSYTRKELDRNG